MNAAGFTNIELFYRNDAKVSIGNNIDEAVDFQLQVGPSGEIIREAGDLGQQKLPELVDDMKNTMSDYKNDAGVILDSSTWFIMARK